MEGHDVPEAVQQTAAPAGPARGHSAAGPAGGPTLPRLLGNQAFATFARAGRRGAAPIAGTRPPAESGDDRALERQLARTVQGRQQPGTTTTRTLARDPKKGTPERQREAERLKAQMPKLEQVSTAAGSARDDLKAFATRGSRRSIGSPPSLASRRRSTRPRTSRTAGSSRRTRRPPPTRRRAATR